VLLSPRQQAARARGWRGCDDLFDVAVGKAASPGVECMGCEGNSGRECGVGHVISAAGRTNYTAAAGCRC
jgi:hypothetical protein